MSEKKKSRRSRVKYPALKKNYNSKIRQEYLDMDYLDQLDDTVKNVELPDGTMVTEKEYMNIFMKEWNNASVAGIKDKTNETAKDRNKLHRTWQEAKICTDQNNARNRDALSQAKATRAVFDQNYEDLQRWLEEKTPMHENTTENAIIALLDNAHNPHDTAEDSDYDSDDTE